jgi:hypothetical protein
MDVGRGAAAPLGTAERLQFLALPRRRGCPLQMGLIGRGGKRFSSRLAVVVVSALLAGGVGVPSFAQGLPTGRASAALAANSRARATTSELGSLMKIFAANGIATVASATATASLVPVSGAVHIRFTEVQVEGMAEQVADHGGDGRDP